jgi:sulfotransferase family protein
LNRPRANERDALPETAAKRGESAGAKPAPFVVVLGMHRSGTSLCSHILGRLGIAMADQPDIQPTNAKGQWERPEIVDRHDRILALLNRGYLTPLHDLPLPSAWWLDPAVGEIRHEIISFLEEELVTAGPFGFKDPRTARLLPLWHQVFDELRLDPKIVLCVRNPAQVARSLEERDGLPSDMGEYRWFVYTAEILRHLRNFETCVIEYEAWFDDAADNLGKLTRFLGLPMQTEFATAIAEIVDRELRHDDRRREPQHVLVRSLYELVRRFNDAEAARTEITEMLDRLAPFEQLQQPMQLEFEQLSRLAAALPLGRREEGTGGRSPVSWRDSAVAAEWQKLLATANQAEALRGRLEQVLQQRAELDTALARAQQQAALRERAAEQSQEELTALRRQLEQQKANPTEASGSSGAAANRASTESPGTTGDRQPGHED